MLFFRVIMVYYKIQEFADRIGVSPATVRNWEKQNIIKPHHRTPTGYRIYTSDQVALVLNGDLFRCKNEVNDSVSED